MLDHPLGPGPTDVGGGVFAQQVRAQDELERNWSQVQGWLGGMLTERGVDRIAAEELSVPPGGDELFSLLQIKAHWESGDWDAIVVDCAPTGETLRLLSFPDVARWWLEKVFGRETQLLAAARPLARAFLDVQLPDERVFMEVQQLVRNLVAMDGILRAPETTLRLVMTPDRMVVKESMRTFTYLNLFGYLTDAVVVNRVFPEAVDGTYFGAWRALQQEQLALVADGFSPVPVLRAPFFDREVLGAEMLDRLGGELFAGDRAAADVMHTTVSQQIRAEGDRAEVRLELPFASKGDVSLKKIGLELVVRVGDSKRVIELPASLAGFRPASATFEAGALVVGFQAAQAVRAGA